MRPKNFRDPRMIPVPSFVAGVPGNAANLTMLANRFNCHGVKPRQFFSEPFGEDLRDCVPKPVTFFPGRSCLRLSKSPVVG